MEALEELPGLLDAVPALTLLGFAALMARIAISALNKRAEVSEQREGICVAKLDDTVTALTAITATLDKLLDGDSRHEVSIQANYTLLQEIRVAVLELLAHQRQR